MSFIRNNLIAAALWLAWAIITPIDWLIDRTRQQPHERSQQGNCEGRGVVGRVHHGKGQ